MRFQFLGVAMQGDVAGSADMDICDLSRRNVHIAMTADTHFGLARGYRAKIGPTRTTDTNPQVINGALGADCARSADIRPCRRAL